MDQTSLEDVLPSTVSGAPGEIKRHPEFYFDDALVTIQVEDTLFTVHKRQLAQSETFLDMFDSPKATGSDTGEGSTEKPIILLGVSASDFQCLLKVLYTPYFSNNWPELNASLLTPAYRLAEKWNFKDLCTHLLPLAEKELHDIDKILFAREFGMTSWLVPAYAELYYRENKNYISTEEAHKLGVDSILLIYHLQRRCGNNPIHVPCESCYRIGRSSEKSCHQCHGRGPLTDVGLTVNVVDHEWGVEAEIKRWLERGCTF